jgi:oligopeptide/dipeptide ABC transporter ATP-binding protein
MDNLLEIRDLKMHFPVREGILLRAAHYNKAVDGVSLEIRPGETLGLVGESGCGKSTLGRCIVNLYKPVSGEIFFEGKEISKLSNKEILPYRQNIQMIFQDPMESLNSRHTVGDILEEPLVIHRFGDSVARPFEFSGGQRQRIGIARAIALNPKLIICDEAVSALDVSIQSQILNLLIDLQREFNLSYLFIAHDLAVVKHVSDRIAIMYLGRIVEIADSEVIHRECRHPYTRSLLSAIPVPDPHRKSDRIVLEGDVPTPIDPPSGCSFHPRCPYFEQRCQTEEPSLRSRDDSTHEFSCHFDLNFTK